MSWAKPASKPRVLPSFSLSSENRFEVRVPPSRSVPACLILLAQVLDAMVAASATGPCATSASNAAASMGVPCANSGQPDTIASVTRLDFRMDVIDMRSSPRVCLCKRIYSSVECAGGLSALPTVVHAALPSRREQGIAKESEQEFTCVPVGFVSIFPGCSCFDEANSVVPPACPTRSSAQGHTGA